MGALDIETPRKFVPLLEHATYKGLHGGRASGKSHFFAEMMIERAIMEPIDAVCLREIQKTLKFSVKKLLEKKIDAMNAGYYFDIKNEEIRRHGGGVIIFQGMQDHNAESIKSLEDFDIAWFEEAQSASAHSLKLLRPTMRTPGAEMWFSWNPNLPTDPIDQLLRGENLPASAVVIKSTYKDNKWLSDESKAEIEYDRSRDKDKFEHVWLGEYQRHSDAQVFRNWIVEEFESPPGAVYRLGADWGFSVDPSVLVRCFIDGHRLYIDYEAYMVGCEIDKLPDLFARVPESDKWFITADSARPETISYMRNHGYPRINKAVKGKKSIEEGVEFLKSYDIVIHPRCTHVIDEVKAYKYKVDPLTEEVLPILEDKDNHTIDALRYACESARRVRSKKKVHKAPKSIGGWMSA